MNNCSATTKELAQAFGVCTRTVERLRAKGRLSYWKVGKQVRFDLESAKSEFQRLGHKVAAA